MGSTPLFEQINTAKQLIFDEGLLDPHRFVQLESLEVDDINPDFIEEVFGLFFRDSTKYIAAMEDSLNGVPVDPYILERNLYRLKGSSANIGATKMRNEVNEMREFCNQGNFESARVCFERLKTEQATLKTKFNHYLELVRQAKEGGSDQSSN